MIKTISPQQAAKFLASGDAVLIDVRETDEFGSEHISYATSLPLGRLVELLAQMNIPLTRKVIFQCQKGGRGGQACALVHEDSAFKNELYNLEGGILAWKEAGLPVVVSKSGGMSIFRQVQAIVGSLILFFILLGSSGIVLGFALAGMLAAALLFAGLTGWCGLALLLSKMPWNR